MLLSPDDSPPNSGPVYFKDSYALFHTCFTTAQAEEIQAESSVAALQETFNNTSLAKHRWTIFFVGATSWKRLPRKLDSPERFITMKD